MSRVFRAFGRFWMWALFLLAVALFIFALLVPIYSLAAMALLLGLSALPFLVPNRSLLLGRGLSLLVLTMLLVLKPLLPMQELQSRFDRLSAKLTRKGARGFTLREKASVYYFGVFMGIGGYLIGYPEAGREHLMLYLPGPKTREWRSDFAMGSRRVRRALRAFKLRLQKSKRGTTGAWMSPRILTFRLGRDPHRVALALNPLVLRARARRHHHIQPWRITAYGTVSVRYKRRARTPLTLSRGVAFVMDQGLFWMLQQNGCLHPYKARWVWSLSSRDPRLR